VERLGHVMFARFIPRADDREGDGIAERALEFRGCGHFGE